MRNAAFEIDGLEGLSKDEMRDVNGGFNLIGFAQKLFTSFPTLLNDGKNLWSSATKFWTGLRGLFN